MTKNLIEDFFIELKKEKQKNPIKYFWSYKVYPWIYKIYSFKYTVKYLYQNIRYGYNDQDTWDISYYTSRKVLPILKKFKNNLHGHPSELSEKEWEAIIDSIILAFELRVKDNQQFITVEDDLLVQKGFELFGKYLNNLWD